MTIIQVITLKVDVVYFGRLPKTLQQDIEVPAFSQVTTVDDESVEALCTLKTFSKLLIALFSYDKACKLENLETRRVSYGVLHLSKDPDVIEACQGDLGNREPRQCFMGDGLVAVPRLNTHGRAVVGPQVENGKLVTKVCKEVG